MARMYRIWGLNSFRTEHGLHPLESPANSYAFAVFAFAIDPITNLSVDIGQFTIANSFDGFTTSARDTKMMKDFTYNADSGPRTVEIVAHVLEVEICRSKSARALAFCMFTTNWALTIMSAYLAFSAIRTGRVSFAMVILHASMMLAIPSIRSLYVSLEPLGAFSGMFRHTPLLHSLMMLR